MLEKSSKSNIYITGSKLETYITCPRKYYFANVRKLQNFSSKRSPLLAFDQSIHKTLCSFYRFHNNSEPFDYTKLLKSLDYNWHSTDYETNESSLEYKEMAISFLKNYFEKYCCKFEDKHIDTDYFFKTTISGIEYGGKIDRIDKNTDGTLEIIDYKTGKIPTDGLSELEDSLTTQLLFAACDVMFPGQVRQLTYIYLKENETLVVKRDGKKVYSAINRFREYIDNLLSEKYEPIPSNACNWCDFRENCPEGQKNTLSLSKLKSFIDCPQKYYFKYVKKQPIYNNEPKSALLFYSYINSFLANLYKGKKLYSVNKSLEHAKKALNIHRELDEETKNLLLNDCKEAFSYINKEIEEKGFPNSKFLKTELKCNYDSLILSVNIDRLDILPNGLLQPVLYKTGKQIPDLNTIKNDVTSALYWFIANNLYPNEIDSVCFVYLLNNQSVNFIPSEIAINRLKECISSFIESNKYKGNLSSLCSCCDYYDPCPNWKIKPYEVANESIEQFKKRIRLSYSKMSLYLNCPYSYKRLYIDKIAPKPQPFFDFGTAIHETFEKVYAPTESIIEKPSLSDIIEIYEKVRLNYRDGFINDQIEEEYHKDGIRQITLYYNHFIKNKVFKPAIAVERYFEIPLGKYAVMTGSIDRIDALGDGTYEILDYKTEPTLRPQEEVDKDKQLSIYYWAAKESLGYDISRLSLLMLDHDIKMKTTRTNRDISEVLEFIDKTAYEMIHETNFIPKKNKYCKSCDHLESCPLKNEILADDALKSMQKF